MSVIRSTCADRDRVETQRSKAIKSWLDKHGNSRTACDVLIFSIVVFCFADFVDRSASSRFLIGSISFEESGMYLGEEWEAITKLKRSTKIVKGNSYPVWGKFRL